MPYETVEVPINGVPFTVVQRPFWEQVRANNWEPGTFHALDRYLRPDKVCLDVGAWVGPITLYAMRKAREVICLEPDYLAFGELRENIALNDGQNTIQLNTGLGHKAGWGKLSNLRAFGDSRSGYLYADAPSTYWTRLATWDDITVLPVVEAINVIKMDVEGMESCLLPSMERWCWDHQPTLLVALHPLHWKQARKEMGAVLKTLAGFPRLTTTDDLPLTASQLVSTLEMGINYDVVATFVT